MCRPRRPRRRRAILSAMDKAIIVGLVALAVGTMGGGALGLTLATPKREAPRVCPLAEPSERDEDELAAANASLVKSLQACNRRLTELGEKRTEPVPTPAAAASRDDGGRRGRGDRQRAALTKEDWERFAKEGVVPYRVPCLRDEPWTPNQRQIDRLGLSPNDTEVMKRAYEKSNERMRSEIQPLCARVVGSKEAADRIGPNACLSAIMDSSRRADADKMKESLVRVAEVNADKRPPPSGPDVPPVEALLLAMTAESRRFEADLAKDLGPEDAARLARARGLCSEQGTARAKPGRGE